MLTFSMRFLMLNYEYRLPQNWKFPIELIGSKNVSKNVKLYNLILCRLQPLKKLTAKRFSFFFFKPTLIIQHLAQV